MYFTNQRFEFAEDRKNFKRWLQARPCCKRLSYEIYSERVMDADFILMYEIKIQDQRYAIHKNIYLREFKNWREGMAFQLLRMRKEMKASTGTTVNKNCTRSY